MVVRSPSLLLHLWAGAVAVAVEEVQAEEAFGVASAAAIEVVSEVVTVAEEDSEADVVVIEVVAEGHEVGRAQKDRLASLNLLTFYRRLRR